MYLANHDLMIHHFYVQLFAWCEVRRAFVKVKFSAKCVVWSFKHGRVQNTSVNVQQRLFS